MDYLALAAIALAVIVAALVAINLRAARKERDGLWHPTDPLTGKGASRMPRMRRWTGSAWEYREMTEPEMNDWLAAAAW